MVDVYVDVIIVSCFNDQVADVLICDNGTDYPLLIKRGCINENIKTIGVYTNLALGFSYFSFINCCLKICAMLNNDSTTAYAEICDVKNIVWSCFDRINAAKVIIGCKTRMACA